VCVCVCVLNGDGEAWDRDASPQACKTMARRELRTINVEYGVESAEQHIESCPPIHCFGFHLKQTNKQTNKQASKQANKTRERESQPLLVGLGWVSLEEEKTRKAHPGEYGKQHS